MNNKITSIRQEIGNTVENQVVLIPIQIRNLMNLRSTNLSENEISLLSKGLETLSLDGKKVKNCCPRR